MQSVPQEDQALASHVAAFNQVELNKARVRDKYYRHRQWGQPPESPEYTFDHVLEVLNGTPFGPLTTLAPSVGWDAIMDEADAENAAPKLTPEQSVQAGQIHRSASVAARCAYIWSTVFDYGRALPTEAWNRLMKIDPEKEPLTAMQFKAMRNNIKDQWERCRRSVNEATAAFYAAAASK